MTAEPALDTLDEWPWPKWEFVTAIPDGDGVTVALAPVMIGVDMSSGPDLTGAVLIVGEMPTQRGEIVRRYRSCGDDECGGSTYMVKIVEGCLDVGEEYEFCETALRPAP